MRTGRVAGLSGRREDGGNMAEYNEIYARATYYDIALGRDVTREVAFVRDLFAKLAGRPLGSVLEIACGPGYHARAFARLGVEAHGLDLRPEMVAFARDRAAEDGVTVDWLAADMRTFRMAKPMDAIVTMYDGIDCLLTQDELIDHFRTVGENLAPDGIYVIELTHPKDTGFAEYGSFAYTGKRGGTEVEVRWAVNEPSHDPATLVAEVDVEMRIRENGQERVIKDRARERMYTAPEIVALARLSGRLAVTHYFGDFRLDQPLDYSEGARRMILVLRPAGRT